MEKHEEPHLSIERNGITIPFYLRKTTKGRKQGTFEFPSPNLDNISIPDLIKFFGKDDLKTVITIWFDRQSPDAWRRYKKDINSFSIYVKNLYNAYQSKIKDLTDQLFTAIDKNDFEEAKRIKTLIDMRKHAK